MLLVLCWAGNEGALVLLCPKKTNSKNYWFERIEVYNSNLFVSYLTLVVSYPN
jgi:hypothetical protein